MRRLLAIVLFAALPACGTDIAAATTGSPTTGPATTLPDGAAPPGLEGGTTLLDGSLVLPDGAVVPPGDAGFCQGSGPVISIPGANTKCTGDVGATTFLFAVCSCKDVSVSGNLYTDSLAATDGGSPGNGGSIGANGSVDTNSMLKVNGSVWALASGETTALHTQQTSTIFGDVHAGAAVQADQPLTIADALYVNGDANGTISCNVAYVPSGDTATSVTATSGIVTAPVTVPAPCDCSSQLPITSIVSSFASANDDATAGLTSSSFASFPSSPVTLPCGQYYFDGVGGGPVSLSIGGRAAIFVNGDFNAQNGLMLSLADGTELDLFISGNLLLGNATLGTPDSPARVRVYVGGSTLTLAGTATVGANLYAPNANVALSSNFTMAGSLFVGALQLSGDFTIHYDESILSTTGCAASGGSCGSCHDCSGATPACISGTCAPCQSDSDCCAPLHCSQGKCYDEIP
jgi:hypothetical protein